MGASHPRSASASAALRAFSLLRGAVGPYWQMFFVLTVGLPHPRCSQLSSFSAGKGVVGVGAGSRSTLSMNFAKTLSLSPLIAVRLSFQIHFQLHRLLRHVENFLDAIVDNGAEIYNYAEFVALRRGPSPSLPVAVARSSRRINSVSRGFGVVLNPIENFRALTKNLAASSHCRHTGAHPALAFIPDRTADCLVFAMAADLPRSSS